MKRMLVVSLALGFAACWAAWAMLPPIRDGQIRLSDALHGEACFPRLSATGKRLCAFPMPKNPAGGFGLGRGPISIWELEEPRLAAQLLGPNERILTVAFTDDDSWLAVGLDDEVRLIDWRTGAAARRLPLRRPGATHHQVIFRIAPDLRHIAVQENSGGADAFQCELTVYRLPEGTEVFRRDFGNLACFSPDGKTFAYFADYKKILRPNSFRDSEESERRQRGVHVVDLATMAERWLRSDPGLYGGLHYRGEKNGTALWFLDDASLVHWGMFSDLNRPGQKWTQFVEVWRLAEKQGPFLSEELMTASEAGTDFFVAGADLVLSSKGATRRVNWRTGQPSAAPAAAWRTRPGERLLARLPSGHACVLGPNLMPPPFYEDWLKKIGIDWRGKDWSPVEVRLVDEATGKVSHAIPNVASNFGLADGKSGRLVLKRGNPQKDDGLALEVWSLPPRRNWAGIVSLGVVATALGYFCLWSRRRLRPAQASFALDPTAPPPDNRSSGFLGKGSPGSISA